ncbi:glycoside hydrolase family 127 protein [Nonomuraea sp. K274]|uniref:Glycoside hydrolase family 127 protein n=1 Tax=Nonomuraea cypriaca TaxID=1187855 RepID=A0A931F4S7_9ACTN|nr:beta-L-arabinofuranosidase domain-containing protein [Nonomuraea cypriaca]MBF8191421.1 glycoside hydrolase family 127 protein [Nonomuraea cypriaca]
MTNGNPHQRELPLGAIRPRGWLRDQLQLQADGQTGRLEEIWPDVGPDSAWLGGDGESWERGPYYLDGLVPLAYTLGAAELQAKAQKWIESMLGGQRADGQFGPAHDLDWWPRMVALKVLTQYADATGDERVPPFLRRYFEHQRAALPDRPLSSWGQARGADNVLSIMWLYDRTGEDWLLDLARLILRQTHDWATFLTERLPAGVTPEFSHLTHGPNVAMGLKNPAAAYLVDGDPGHAGTFARMWDHLDELHGQVHGVFSGDEWLGGRDPHHGVETCQVVELMFTLEQLARIFGDGRHGDLLEQVAFNLLAASNDPRMLAHQYHQQANQVLVSFGQRDWSFSGPDANVFGHEPHFGCCTANLHQGWPKLVRSLWMRAGEDVFNAVAYAPCQVDAGPARLDVVTDYPFDETVRIEVSAPEPAEFAVGLRIPAWCEAATLVVAGEDVAVVPDERGYVTVRRVWRDGDVIELTLPMRLRTVPRDRGAIGFRFGPLVMAHGVPEIWRSVPGHRGLAEWEITPRTAWNFGAWLEDPDGVDSWRVERRPVSPVPFAADAAPLVIHGKGAMIRDWRLVNDSAGLVPDSPASTGMPVLPMPLLPYGSARLRVAELPTVKVAGAHM